MNKSNTIFITIAVMSATVMQVLDTTIVNVALPNMQGSFAANNDQISWVLTSYLVSSAIFMPLTGYLSDKLGRKNYLILSVIGFTVASMLCGISFNLQSMVIFRLLQGIFGAALVPLSQAILVDCYPLEKRGQAMAIWGMGVMLGPILGPTLGGYLTETLNWRWTFFINLPIGLFSLFLAMKYLPEVEKRNRLMDWQGLICLSLAIGSFQYVLDQGNQKDWLENDFIKMMALICVVSLILFVHHSLRTTVNKKTLFDVKIFRDRNFFTSSVMISALGVGMYGSMILQPLMMEGLLNYPTITTGLIMAPRGFSSMFSMMCVGKLINKVDPKYFIIAGILCCAFATAACTSYTTEINVWWLVWPILLQGLGVGLIMTPLSTLALSTIEPKLMTEASGLFSLMRTIGSSAGISIISAIYARHIQISWHELSSFFNVYNPNLQGYLESHNIDLNSLQTPQIMAKEIAVQAGMLAITDTYKFMVFSFLAMLPFAMMLKKKIKL